MSLSCYNYHLHMVQEVSIWKKHHLLYSFFFVRRVIAPLVTFLFYCVVIPLSAMVPGVSIPVWGLVYIPTAITFMNAIRNPGYAYYKSTTVHNLPSPVNVAIFIFYCMIYQVSPSDALLDSVRECYVHAPHACCCNWFT